MLAGLLGMSAALAAAEGVAEKPEDAKGLAVGDAVPAATLKNAKGEAVELAALLKEKPAVVIFYRGGWCPFCTRHLAALQKVEPQLAEQNLKLVAITPDDVAKLAPTAEKHGVSFTLLSDPQNAAAKAFKLAFRMDEGTIAKYRSYKMNLDAQDWTLPVPAVYVVGRDGKILFAHANPDYKARLAPEDVVKAASAAAKP